MWCDWLSYYDYDAVKLYLCTMMSKCKWSGTAQYLTLNSWTRTLYSSIRFSETWITCIYIKKPQNSLRSAEPVHRLCRSTYVTQLEKYYITSSQDQSCPRVYFLFTFTTRQGNVKLRLSCSIQCSSEINIEMIFMNKLPKWTRIIYRVIFFSKL